MRPTAKPAIPSHFARTPDIAIIDLNLPGLSGLELVRRILQREPQAKIIIFSMNDDPAVAARAIEAGYKGYVTKGDDDPALFTRRGEISRGGRRLSAPRNGEVKSPFSTPVRKRRRFRTRFSACARIPRSSA